MSPRAAVRLEQIGFQQVHDYVAGKADWLAFGLPIEGEQAGKPDTSSLARDDAPTVGIDDPLALAGERMQESDWDSCVVVDDQRVVLGLLHKADISEGGTVEERMELGPSTYRPNADPKGASDYMERHDVPSVIVSDSFGHLFGLLRREDAKRAAGD